MKIKLFEEKLKRNFGGRKVSLDFCKKNIYNPNGEAIKLEYIVEENFDLKNLFGIYLIPNRYIDNEAEKPKEGFLESFLFIASKDGVNISDYCFESSFISASEDNLKKIYDLLRELEQNQNEN